MDNYALFALLQQALENGQDVALATVVRTQGSVPRHAGSKMLVWADGRMAGTVGGGMLESRVVETAVHVLETARPDLLQFSMTDMQSGDVGICGGTVDVFVEPVLPSPTVLVVGCGHVGKEVAALARWVGFRVLVSDDRVEMCTPEQIPDMDGYYPVPASEIARHLPLSSQTYVALMTRGQVVDLELLPPLLQAPVPYIGLIGSRRRWALTVEALRDRGLTDADLVRIRAPVGLEIQAETPREIAVSILAEIIMHRNGGDGQPMQWAAPGMGAAPAEQLDS